MKKLLSIAGAAIALVIVAGVLAPFLISADAYKGQILARLRDATGRDIAIAGPLSLSLFPTVRVEAAEVSLANPPGAQSAALATVKKLEIAVRLMPLLSGRIEIERLVLVDPAIDLEIDARGQPNWNLARAGAGGGDPSTIGLAALSRLQLTAVTIENGDIVLLDRRTGAREELTQGAMTLSAPRLDAPFTAAGTAQWRGEKVGFAVKLDATGALIQAGGKTGLTVSLTARPLRFDFAGTATNTGKGGAAALMLDGKANLAMPSLRDFVTWSGRDITLPKHGFGAFALAGPIHAENGVATFPQAKIVLDAIAATGTMALDLGAVRPAITARLRTGMLDLNPYLPPPVPGWDSDKFDIAVFRGVNAEIAVAAQGVRFRHIHIGETTVAAHLLDAKLTLDVGPMALYRGSGKAEIRLDATGPTAALRIGGALSGVDIAALARDAAGIDAVAGTGNFSLAGTAHGNSERDLIASLGGRAAFRLTNGAVGGVDLGGMLKNSAGASGQGDAGRTAIARASADYTIARGIMHNGDLAVSTDTIDATGAGTIDLPARTLNYRITPRLIAGIVTVPVMVSGPWDRLRFQPDVAGIAKGLVLAPVNVLGGAAGAGQGIGNKVGSTLKNLFGN